MVEQISSTDWSPVSVKTCSKCRIEQDIGNFSRNIRQKDGFHVHCKSCDRERNRIRYTFNSNRTVIISSSKICPKCNEFKTPDLFPNRKSSNCGLDPYCKQCHKESNSLMKMKLWNELGGPKCIECLETEPEFLTLQHKHGDGRKHRNMSRNWMSVYDDVLADPNRLLNYEVLCANCNMLDSIVRFNDDRRTCLRSDKSHEYHRKLKLLAHRKLSNGIAYCNCCGESHPDKLCIDHIKPFSQDHHGPRSGFKLYKLILTEQLINLTNFQVFCFNCNQSKQVFQQCIHKRFLKATELIDLHYTNSGEDIT